MNSSVPSASAKPIMWTLAQALPLMHALQPKLKPLGFHVALAGGVLNRGASQKDLDLLFLPLTNDAAPATKPLRQLLTQEFGVCADWEITPDAKGVPRLTYGGVASLDEAEFRPSHVGETYSPYRLQLCYRLANTQRVDVFIV